MLAGHTAPVSPEEQTMTDSPLPSKPLQRPITLHTTSNRALVSTQQEPLPSPDPGGETTSEDRSSLAERNSGETLKKRLRNTMMIMTLKKGKKEPSFNSLKVKVVDKVIRSSEFVTMHAGTHGELLRDTEDPQQGSRPTTPQQQSSRHSIKLETQQSSKALLNTRFVFMPKSRLRRAVAFSTMAAILVATIFGPYELAFISQWHPNSKDFTLVLSMYVIMDGLFLLEILCQFRTAYRNYSGLLETGGRQIARRYIKSYRFMSDMAGAFPYGVVGALKKRWFYFKLGEFFKLFFVLRMTSALAEGSSGGGTKNMMSMANGVQLLRLFATFLILTHWCGCLWRKLNTWEGVESWTYLANEGGSSQFDASFSASSYTGVIYSSASMLLGQQALPRTVPESYFIICSMLFGACLNAVLFGQVNVILNSFNRSTSRYMNLLQAVKENMDGMNLPENIRERVFEHFEYQWQVSHCTDRERFLSTLSLPLKSEISFALYGKMMARIPFFVGLAPHCQVAITNLIRPQYFLPGDHIINQGEATTNKSSIYFVKHGKVGVTTAEQPGALLCLLQDNDFFGEIGYLSRGTPRSSTVIALTMCNCGSLTYADLDTLLMDYPTEQAFVQKHIAAHVQRYRGDDYPAMKLRPALTKKSSAANMLEKLERLEKLVGQAITQRSPSSKRLMDTASEEGKIKEEEDDDATPLPPSSSSSPSSPPRKFSDFARQSSLSNFLKPRASRGSSPSPLGGSLSGGSSANTSPVAVAASPTQSLATRLFATVNNKPTPSVIAMDPPLQSGTRTLTTTATATTAATAATANNNNNNNNNNNSSSTSTNNTMRSMPPTSSSPKGHLAPIVRTDASAAAVHPSPTSTYPPPHATSHLTDAVPPAIHDAGDTDRLQQPPLQEAFQAVSSSRPVGPPTGTTITIASSTSKSKASPPRRQSDSLEEDDVDDR